MKRARKKTVHEKRGEDRYHMYIVEAVSIFDFEKRRLVNMHVMRNFKEITRRMNIQEIRSFVLDGIDLSNWRVKLDTDNYEERLRKGEAPLWEFLENLYPDGDKRDDAYDIICKAIITNQEVYTELGIQLGANLIFELLRTNTFKETDNDKEKR